MLGERLHKWRKENKWTIAYLSDIVGIPKSSLSEIENGKYLPSGDFLTRLAEHTNIDIRWLLTGEGQGIDEHMQHLIDDPDFEKFLIMYEMYKKLGDGEVDRGDEIIVNAIKSIADTIGERIRHEAQGQGAGKDKGNRRKA